jgi:hypothetical protein
MKKILLATIIFLIFLSLLLFFITELFEKKIENNFINLSEKETFSILQKTIDIPINKAISRINKKPFGIKVSPQNSPISPEKFSGFHTGADFEIFENETEKKVNVKAICDGDIMQKTSASGYGGIIIQKCKFENNPMLVLYGHIDLNSVTKKMKVEKDDFLAPLAQANSPESGFERKHLHLGIIRGEKMDYRGYVETEKELSKWIDPILIIK